MDSDVTLNAWDIVSIIAYFVLVIGVSIYAMYVTKRGSIDGYFLAGRFVTFIPVGASLFASNIGSEHFIGLAGSGASSGIGVGSFELNAIILLQLLGLLFIPVYIASGVYTLPEYMEKRFGGKKRIRIYLSFLSVVLYIFTKISVDLYSGALFIQRALEWNLYTSVVLLVLLTAVTTLTGGLADTLQTVIMLIGASVVAVLSLNEVGGFSGLQQKYTQAVPVERYANTSCGLPRDDSFVMLRGPTSDIPWPGFILGYLKILPVFLMVIPGMVSRVLYTDTVGCATEDTCMQYCKSKVSCSNLAYPELVINIMPTGLRGIMIAVMLAALMSDLTSIFNSASTLFTMDIWPLFRKAATTKEKLLVGRGFVLIMTAASILWIPVIEVLQGGQLFIYIQAISAYLSPPIAAVYLLAVLSKRVNEQGAFWGLTVGTVVGIIRMIWEFASPAPRCGLEDTRSFVVKLHYMYFAIVGFWLTLITSVIVSYVTTKPTQEELSRTTVWTLRTPLSQLKDVATPPRDTEQERDKARDIKEKKWYINAALWICGLNEVEGSAADHKEKSIDSLEQTPFMKKIIWANSIIIITIGFILYLYFTFGFKP